MLSKIQNRFGQLFGSKETAIENLHDFKIGRFASSAAIELLEITKEPPRPRWWSGRTSQLPWTQFTAAPFVPWPTWRLSRPSPPMARWRWSSMPTSRFWRPKAKRPEPFSPRQRKFSEISSVLYHQGHHSREKRRSDLPLGETAGLKSWSRTRITCRRPIPNRIILFRSTPNSGYQ